mmetsp:Transcript_977/g.2066  ORF Transcript_977/g.2066 Transcript_977/m.2066 type:complete len:243 (-) Transcript_977:606-1334(-)
MYNRCIRTCSLSAASMAASNFFFSLGSISGIGSSSSPSESPLSIALLVLTVAGQHGLFRKLICCSLGNNGTTISKNDGKSSFPTRLPSYRNSVTIPAVLGGTPYFNASGGRERFDKSSNRADCLWEPASCDMARHRSSCLIRRSFDASGVGVGGASISGELIILVPVAVVVGVPAAADDDNDDIVPPRRFGVDGCVLLPPPPPPGVVLLTGLGLPLDTIAALLLLVLAFGVKASRLAICCGY